MSQLIYFSNIQEDFIFKLKIHYSFFFLTGAVYLGKYVFTNKPVVGAKESNMSEADINFIFLKKKKKTDKDRSELQKTKGRKVIIKEIEGNKDTMLFDSISSSITFIKVIAPSNR